MTKLEDSLREELMAGMAKAPKKATPKKKPKLFKAGKHKVVLEDKQKPFSEVVGMEAPSGIDHAITVFEPTDWDDEMQAHLLDKDKYVTYIGQPKELELLLVAWEMEDNTSIFGPTGSGKSSMVEYACALTGRPFIRINGRGDMESSSLLGMLTAKDGSTEWVDGTITEGVRLGAIVCVDEREVVPREIMMALQWLLEDDGKLFLSDLPASNSERLVYPHSHFRLVCTSNTRGSGDDTGKFSATNVQNSATIDRFGTVIHLDYLPSTHESSMLFAKYPSLQKDLVTNMLKVAGLIRNGYNKDELALTMSPRTLLNWSKKALYYKDHVKAFDIAFLEKLPSEADRNAVRGMYKTVFDV